MEGILFWNLFHCGHIVLPGLCKVKYVPNESESHSVANSLHVDFPSLIKFLTKILNGYHFFVLFYLLVPSGLFLRLKPGLLLWNGFIPAGQIARDTGWQKPIPFPASLPIRESNQGLLCCAVGFFTCWVMRLYSQYGIYFPSVVYIFPWFGQKVLKSPLHETQCELKVGSIPYSHLIKLV